MAFLTELYNSYILYLSFKPLIMYKLTIVHRLLSIDSRSPFKDILKALSYFTGGYNGMTSSR